MSVEAYVFITTTNPGPRKACQAIRLLPLRPPRHLGAARLHVRARRRIT